MTSIQTNKTQCNKTALITVASSGMGKERAGMHATNGGSRHSGRAILAKNFIRSNCASGNSFGAVAHILTKDMG